MASVWLSLPPAAEITTSSNEEGDEHGKYGGKARAEARPMDIDEAKSMVGLVQVDVAGFMVDFVVDGKVRIVLEEHGRGGSSCSGSSLELAEGILLVTLLHVVDN